MKEHKNLLILVDVLLILSVLSWVFRDKLAALFKKDSDEPAGGDPGQNTPVSAIRNKNIAVADPVYSDGAQQIQRIRLADGRYHSTDENGQPLGQGPVSDGSLIGSVIKLTSSGYYVRAKPGMKTPYYWVGKSQVFTK